MTAANFLARMNNITRPQGAPTQNSAPVTVAAQPQGVSAPPAAAPGGFTIPGTAPAAPASLPATVAPPFSGGVVGMPSAPVNELTQQNAPVVQSMTSAAVAPFQINPPEGSLPPPEPPTAADPPPPPETLPDAAGKGGRKRKAASGAAPAAPSVSDDYLEHHARQCAALQGAFANPNLSALSPDDFANYVLARLSAFETLGGAK